MSEQQPNRVTVPTIRSRKGSAIVMVTAYDAPTARLVDPHVDIILVGDSVAMVVLGHETTLSVTMDEMLHHTRAVVRGREHALVVGDMPYLSYHLGRTDAVRNAARFIKEAGADAVKIEGGAKRAPIVEALIDAEIPVMGHVGLTPQSHRVMGGFRIQGRQADAARGLIADAEALDHAGVFSIVIEGVPVEVGKRITEAVSVPTIGIGAGPACDGQVLVLHDVIGIVGAVRPRFVRQYAQVGQEISRAVSEFASDVRAGSFPAAGECYHLDAEGLRDLERAADS